MNFIKGDIYYDKEADAIRKEIESENKNRRSNAEWQAYQHFLNIAREKYSDVDGVFYYFDVCELDSEYIKELNNKFGTGYTVFNFNYSAIDFDWKTYVEHKKEKTGNYKVNIGENYYGALDGKIEVEEKTVDITHKELRILGEETRSGFGIFPHWKEKPHKYSNEVGCVNILKKYDGFFEGNKKLLNGKLFHPRFNYALSVIMLVLSTVLFFVSCFNSLKVLSICFAAVFLITSIFSFLYFIRLSKRKAVDSKTYAFAAIFHFVFSLIAFAFLTSKNYIELDSFIPFTCILNCVHIIPMVISFFVVGDDFNYYDKKQNQFFADGAFKYYKYFKENYKNIIVGRIYDGSGTKDKKQEKAIAEPVVEYECRIKEIKGGEEVTNEITSIIIKYMNVSLNYALKAVKGKTIITLDTATIIKKSFPETVIYKYKKVSK